MEVEKKLLELEKRLSIVEKEEKKLPEKEEKKLSEYKLIEINKGYYKLYIPKLDAYACVYGDLNKINFDGMEEMLPLKYDRLSEMFPELKEHLEYLKKIYCIVIYDNNQYMKKVSRAMFDDFFDTTKINMITLGGVKIKRNHHMFKLYELK